jgi:hypothetical protein
VSELLNRAQQLVAAGPYDARPAEIAAVHDAIWPEKAPVCPTLTCRKVLGVAYFSIKRWTEQQGAASNAPLSLSTMKKSTSVARFKSSDTIYTPHGLGVAYSNANLTDKAARYILEKDPDAAALFSALPPEDEDAEDEQELTPAQQVADKALSLAENPKQSAPDGFDYAKLASAMVDELERRAQERDTKTEQDLDDDSEQDLDDATSEQPPLTASTGGAADAGQETDETDNSDSNSDTSDSTSNYSDADNSAAPVRLSRMNKEQLLATYRAEVQAEGGLLLVDAHNDDLRNAIAEKRASLQDPE